LEVGTGDGHMEIDSNNSPQRNSSNCRRKERERKKVGRLVGSSWEVGNERKREKEREREKKKSPNEDKYMYVCAHKLF
jgi:hypothetical protein